MSLNKNLDNICNYYFIHVVTPFEFGGATGTYNLFTWAESNRIFIPCNLSFVVISRRNNTWTTSPTCSIGTNSTSFNNWIASSTATIPLSNMNMVGQFNISTLITGIPAMTSGTILKLNNTALGTANAYSTLEFTIEGYALPA